MQKGLLKGHLAARNVSTRLRNPFHSLIFDGKSLESMDWTSTCEVQSPRQMRDEEVKWLMDGSSLLMVTDRHHALYDGLLSARSQAEPTLDGSEEGIILCGPTGSGRTSAQLFCMIAELAEGRGVLVGLGNGAGVYWVHKYGDREDFNSFHSEAFYADEDSDDECSRRSTAASVQDDGNETDDFSVDLSSCLTPRAGQQDCYSFIRLEEGSSKAIEYVPGVGKHRLRGAHLRHVLQTAENNGILAKSFVASHSCRDLQNGHLRISSACALAGPAITLGLAQYSEELKLPCSPPGCHRVWLNTQKCGVLDTTLWIWGPWSTRDISKLLAVWDWRDSHAEKLNHLCRWDSCRTECEKGVQAVGGEVESTVKSVCQKTTEEEEDDVETATTHSRSSGKNELKGLAMLHYSSGRNLALLKTVVTTGKWEWIYTAHDQTLSSVRLPQLVELLDDLVDWNHWKKRRYESVLTFYRDPRGYTGEDLEMDDRESPSQATSIFHSSLMPLRADSTLRRVCPVYTPGIESIKILRTTASPIVGEVAYKYLIKARSRELRPLSKQGFRSAALALIMRELDLNGIPSLRLPAHLARKLILCLREEILKPFKENFVALELASHNLKTPGSADLVAQWRKGDTVETAAFVLIHGGVDITSLQRHARVWACLNKIDHVVYVGNSAPRREWLPQAKKGSVCEYAWHLDCLPGANWNSMQHSSLFVRLGKPIVKTREDDIGHTNVVSLRCCLPKRHHRLDTAAQSP